MENMTVLGAANPSAESKVEQSRVEWSGGGVTEGGPSQIYTKEEGLKKRQRRVLGMQYRESKERERKRE